jgi:hypothetical protein
MGMERSVTYPKGEVPAWTEVSELLNRGGCPVQVLMIDGELSFPDEQPPESWRELRVRLAEGMVTIRRQEGHIITVTWGNADAALIRAWNALTWALAEVGEGVIEGPMESLTAQDFARQADLPASLRVP